MGSHAAGLSSPPVAFPSFDLLLAGAEPPTLYALPELSSLIVKGVEVMVFGGRVGQIFLKNKIQA